MLHILSYTGWYLPHVLRIKKVSLYPGKFPQNWSQISHLSDSFHKFNLKLKYHKFMKQLILLEFLKGWGTTSGTCLITHLVHPAEGLLQVCHRCERSSCPCHCVHVTGVGNAIGQLLSWHHDQHTQTLLVIKTRAGCVHGKFSLK